MAAGAGATGARSWLATRHWRMLTPRRMRVVSVGLIGAAVVTASVLLGGSGA